MTEDRTCPECGSKLPAHSPAGICPKCLLKVGMDNSADDPAGDATLITNPEANTGGQDEPPTQNYAGQDAEAPSIGTKVQYFGDYELLGEIARGGMGVVYKARQVRLNRTVALKMILAGQFAGEADVQRFQTEAESAAQLDYPGIVPIFEVGEHEGHHFFSMGLVEGDSLAARIADGPLPPAEAAELVRKIAEAIQYAHEKGVVHRDLKPANILIDNDGQPRVTDFGLAKKVKGDSNLTASGQILGTPSYMPPEQAAGRIDQVNESADVYSLGAVLYATLTGRPPFQADNPLDTLMHVLEREPVAPRALNPTLPLDLETICLKCLEKDRRRRYESARSLSAELQRFLNGEPILARPIGRTARAWRWCRRNPVVAGLTTTVVVSLLVGLTTTIWQWSEADKQRQEAERRRQETLEALNASQSRLARLYVERGLKTLDTDPHNGLPWLVEALRVEPEGSRQAAMHRLRIDLLLQDAPELAEFWPVSQDAQFSDDGSKLAIAVQNRVLIYELNPLRRSGQLPHDDPVYKIRFSPNAEQILTLALTNSNNAGAAQPTTIGRLWSTQSSQPLTDGVRLDDPQLGGRSRPEIEFTQNGKQFLAISGAMLNRHYVRMSIRVHDATTLELLADAFAHHHNDEYLKYRLSPDRSRVLTLHGKPFTGPGEDQEDWTTPALPQVWDVMTGEPVTPPLNHELDHRSDGDFAADGSLVLTGGTDGARAWDAQTGKLQTSFVEHGRDVEMARFLHGTMAVSSDSEQAFQWDAATGEKHANWMHSGTFTVDSNGQYALWDEEGSGSGYIQHLGDSSLSSFVRPSYAQFSPNGARFVSRRTNGRHEVRRSNDGRALTPPFRFTGQLSFDGRYLMSRDDSGVWLWDLNSRSRVFRSMGDAQRGHVIDAAFSSDAHRMAVLENNGTITLWNTLDEPHSIRQFQLEGDWKRLVLSPDGQQVLTIGNAASSTSEPTPERKAADITALFDGRSVWKTGGSLRVWSTTGRPVTPPLTLQTVTDAQFTPDGKQLVATAVFTRHVLDASGETIRSPDETELTVWDLSTGKLQVDRRRIPYAMRLNGFNRNGSRAVMTSVISPSPNGQQAPQAGKSVEFWSTETWKRTSRPIVPEKGVPTVVVPFGERVCIAGDDGTSELWDMANGKRLLRGMRHPEQAIDAVRVSKDGSKLATLVVDFRGAYVGQSEIRLWNPESGEPLAPPIREDRSFGHPRICFSPSGDVLAAAGPRAVRLWDTTTGLPLTPPLPLTQTGDDSPWADPPHEIAFSPDGRSLYVEAPERIWRLSLNTNDQTTDELRVWAEMLSGHRIDAAGGFIPLVPADYARHWNELRTAGNPP